VKSRDHHGHCEVARGQTSGVFAPERKCLFQARFRV
jgi:hypothetical protein